MFRWLFFCLTVTAICTGIAWYVFNGPNGQLVGGEAPEKSNSGIGKASTTKSNGERLPSASILPAVEVDPQAPEPPPNAQAVANIENAVLSVDGTQSVTSEFDGKLLFIGTEIPPGYIPRPKDEIFEQDIEFLGILLKPSEITNDQVYVAKSKSEKRNYRRWKEDDSTDALGLAVLKTKVKFRRLREGDKVERGDLLALVDPTRTYSDLAIKVSKLDASYAQWLATTKTRDEAEKRYERNKAIVARSPDAVSRDELGLAKVTWEKYVEDAKKDEYGIEVARCELKQVVKDLKLHEIRSSIPGRIKAIYKNRGEAIKGLEKSAETILLIQNPDILTIEGQVDIQFARNFKPGDEIIVEPFQKIAYQRELRGNMAPITGLAVSKDSKIVSVSEDGLGIVWDPKTGKKFGRLPHKQIEIRAVACTSPECEHNWCVTGAADGIGRLWDLDKLTAKPAVEFAKIHLKPINCVAFSPKGRWCATGSDDNSICIWDAATGDFKERLTHHRGSVTSVQFISEHELVSTSADKTLILWKLDNNGMPTHLNPYPYRSGDVKSLGVNPTTRQVLFDKGKDLQLLALPDGSILGELQNASRSMTFTTMALFSPLGDLILTNDATRNYVQLWRAPNPETRAYELCQLVYDKSPATCGAFDPNNRFIVTGTQSGFVLVWPMPTEQEVKRQLTAWIVNLDTAVEGDLNKVRVKAQIDNADGFLKPDGKVTMVAYPKKE
jgi:hypothetical protein